MATQLVDAVSGVRGRAVCRYYGENKMLAENDTIGITVESDTYLHTVPAGGQDLHDALLALEALIGAGYGASHSPNDQYDMCLQVDGKGASVTLTLPVYTVA